LIMKRYTILCILLGIIIGLTAFPAKITSWQIKDDVKRLNDLHISVDYVNAATQTILIDVPNEQKLQKVIAQGFLVQRLPDRAKEYAQQLLAETNGTRDPMRNYLTLAEYQTFMQNTAAQYPNICQLVQFGTSIQNRPLYFLKISDNVNVEENEPEFRHMSSIHGNEVVGYDMCIRMIQYLTTEYPNNVRVSELINNTEIWICPMFNPDGYANQQRENAAGIDLNRNYPMPTGQQHPDDEAWAPENIAMMNLSAQHSFNLSGMMHGGEYVVNYLWDYTYALAPDNSLLIQGALAYADHNPTLHNSTSFPNGITNGAAWYVITGSLQDWLYGYSDEINYTLEIGDYWPNQSLLDGYWANNQESMLSLMEFVQRGVHGTVLTETGAPLAATITVANNAKQMHTDPQVGDFHRLLLPGTYTLTASCEGYTPASASVTVPITGRTTHNFVLAPATMHDFTGTVINQNGAVVSGAVVKLINGTDVDQAITDANGNFTIPGIYPNIYTLSATAAGMGSFNQEFDLTAQAFHQIIILTPPLYTEDFESGTTNWTLQSPWATITQTGNHVLTDSPTGQYGNNVTLNATLTNPINMQNVVSPVLNFEIKHNLESGYDFCRLQASTTGAIWTNLAEYTGVQSTWLPISIPLTAYANQNLRLRFQLSSDNSVTADGVYIDNISISGTQTNVCQPGDVDSNSLINLNDSQFVLDYALGGNPLPDLDSRPWIETRLTAADVNADSNVTATDAYIIANKYHAYNGAFPSQGGQAYSFSNPNLSLDYQNGQIVISAANPQNLKCYQLSFYGDPPVDLGESFPQFSQVQGLTSAFGTFTIGMVYLDTDPLENSILRVDCATAGNSVTAQGWVNGAPFNQIIDTTALEDNNASAPHTGLMGNYPNPFNPNTTIRYSVAKDNTPIRILVYNAKGQKVKTLVDTVLSKGIHTVAFDGQDAVGNPLGNGMYYYQLITDGVSQTQKMVLLK
jgi:murein tripeptide amidase MpaA